MPTLVHFEIPPDEVERSRKFYIHLFEWKESHFRSWGIFLGLQSVYTHLATSGIVIDRIDSSSKIVEHWAKRDDLGLLQQIGVIPQQGK